MAGREMIKNREGARGEEMKASLLTDLTVQPAGVVSIHPLLLSLPPVLRRR